MTYRAQVDAILDADGWTTDREVAADLGCAANIASQHRRAWQRAHNVVHNNGNRPLPPDVVKFIWEAREDENLSWREVARGVSETFDLVVAAGRCADLYRRGGYIEKRSSPNVNPNEVVFPLKTTVGVMYGARIDPPAYQHRGLGKHETCCDHCPHRTLCAQPNAVCRCETVQEDEVMG